MSNDTTTKPAVSAEQELQDLENQILNGSLAEKDEGIPSSEDSQSTQADDTTPASDSAPDKPNASTDDGSNPKDTATSDGEDSDDDEDVSQMSERAQKRIKKLTERIKQQEEQLLAEKKARLLSMPPIIRDVKAGNPSQPQGNVSKPVSDTPEGMPWNQDKEITPEEYEMAVTEKAQSIVQSELRKEKMLAQMRADTAELEALYPELNPEDPANYNDKLAVSIATDFRTRHLQDPTLRLKDYVVDRMQFKEQWEAQAKAAVTGVVVKQHATQPVSPMSMKSMAPKGIEDKVRNAKSIQELDELEAEINAGSK